MNLTDSVKIGAASQVSVQAKLQRLAIVAGVSVADTPDDSKRHTPSKAQLIALKAEKPMVNMNH